MTISHRALSRARAQDGVTMIIAMGVMLVTSLLLAATFLATQGDIRLSHTDTAQKEAYYAALAGVQEFEYEMQVNPNYWQTCGEPANKLPQESSSSYKVKIMPAKSAPTGTTECLTSNPFETAIESTGAAANTFRVESVGYAGTSPKEKHTIVATFKVTGFLNFIYYTNHEDEDPSLYNASPKCAEEKTYYPETSECELIVFASGDSIEGPMHTNDAPCLYNGTISFGRSGHTPPDVVEFYKGLNTSPECGGTGKYYTATKSYIKKGEGAEWLEPPKSDKSLETYALEEDEFSGVTTLELNGSTNKIMVHNAALPGGKEEIEWPSNGLIWVKAAGACGYTYKPLKSDESNETTHETNCANVYVSGTYSKPLTIGSGNDVIINGEIYPYGQKGVEPPTGTATLGLIANNFVRVYHPCENNTNGSGSLQEPWIYAAILSTTHSFVVDNYNCGAKLGDLKVYGAIAQNYRGIVGTVNGTTVVTGYNKNYKYDERLAVDEPPYFLSPLNAGWKVSRETSPSAG